MKVLSFIGTGDYQETGYALDGATYSTRFAPVAMCALAGATDLVLALTTAAESKYGSAVAAEMEGRLPRVAVTKAAIPDGTREEEIWQIFDALVEHVNPGDTIVIDITHGFRSLPVLAVIAAAYLRVARGAHIRRLLYGAYEARSADNISPVFDLTPFLALLDWTAAMEQFAKTGNAVPLAALLREIQDVLRRAGGDRAGLPTRLKPAADALAGVSEAMRLIRVHEAMRGAHGLLAKLDQARADTAAWARPFAVLLDQAREAYLPLALASPESAPVQDLAVQLEMIRWYAEKGWGAEAVALAREWVVSLESHRSGLGLLSKRHREAAEGALGAAVDARRPARAEESTTNQAVPTADPLPGSVRVWSELADLRNDIAHAGMRPGPRPARGVGEDIVTLHSKLTALFDEVRGQEGVSEVSGAHHPDDGGDLAAGQR